MRGEALDDVLPVRAGRRKPLLSPQEREFDRARQDFVDALPVAAAVIRLGDGGEPVVDLANDGFRELVGPAGLEESESAFLAASEIGPRIRSFLLSEETICQFDATDGKPAGGRIFSVRLVRFHALPVFGRRIFVTLLDKTAVIETEKSLRAEMVRDSLTGLPNRTAFTEQVEAVLEDPSFQPGSHAVLVVDIIRFSRVNECVGALAGDELLITFARRLVSTLRANDLLARTGGDEFAILLRLDRGLEDALQAAERIRASLSEPFRLSELEIRVDCAVGCALLSGGEDLSEEVLRNAQFALKRAKSSGAVQIYEPNQARAARRRFSIETELRRAVEAGGLRLAMQPIVDLRTGGIPGFEALARWNHGTRGPIAPTEFIGVAEESGLIVPLGRWALEQALQILSDWDEKAGRVLPVSVSVNLSPIQIARDDIAGTVAELLDRFGLQGERLTLELTESAIVQDPNRAAEVLAALQKLNVRVAMDDFGTGYTSLAYLQRLPIDVLKIDRSFVRGMLADTDSVAIVRAILSLANALGMDTTAEGIDAPELVPALRELGCSHGQGFHFARPLEPAAALDYWLSLNA
ncbi:MAG TPA: bifunctional diguanylate cyclase/phosphodiesterase [Allosphingosinicella sp.]|nr:bifunctional diguanylate cyclase/phosphodiesterase [Allosphingosinicella sp.]